MSRKKFTMKNAGFHQSIVATKMNFARYPTERQQQKVVETVRGVLSTDLNAYRVSDAEVQFSFL